MPKTPESLLAAVEYRRDQGRVRAAFLRSFIALWPLLVKTDVARTSPNWLKLSVTLIEKWRVLSATTARAYYERAHLLDTGRSAPFVGYPDDIEPEKVYKSLLVTGPGELRKARLLGLDELEAENRALVASSGAASRHVLNAGREQIDKAIKADSAALGYMRVTDGDPCAFCAMLASRGAVYKSEFSAKFTTDARGEITLYHDNCACHVVPVFTRTPVLPEINQRFADLWRSSTRGYSGNDARIAFRRALEGR